MQKYVKKLVLIGSFATDTATPYSDIDFVVYGDVDMDKLEYDLEKIETLRKIDILEYETIRNQYLLEDILVKLLGIDDIALGSPRANLQAAFSNGLIDDDVWLQMLKTRNLLAHD